MMMGSELVNFLEEHDLKNEKMAILTDELSLILKHFTMVQISAVFRQ